MDRKIIPFRTASSAPATDAARNRALFTSDTEDEWVTSTIPQAKPPQARPVY